MEDGVVLWGVHKDGSAAILFIEAGVWADLGVAYHLAFVLAISGPHVGKKAPGTHPGGWAVGTFTIGVGAVGAEVKNLIVVCMEDAVDPLQYAHAVPVGKRVGSWGVCLFVDSINRESCLGDSSVGEEPAIELCNHVKKLDIIVDDGPYLCGVIPLMI